MIDLNWKCLFSHNTGTTQWDDPRDLPIGWEQVDDPVYGTFYVESVQSLIFIETLYLHT